MIRLLVLGFLLLPAIATAQVLELEPVADNAMYSEDGATANGAGGRLFVGRIVQGDFRRSLVRFDLSSLPANAVVESAEFSLQMSRSIAPQLPVAVHRVLAPWGEGTSDAGDPGGLGTAAATGDATWTLRFFPDQPWTTPGGDFAAAASASTPVGGIDRYAWSGPGLVADIEAWRADPSSNHGWILVGDETQTSAKRFDSREATDAGSRPRLAITYSLVAPPGPAPVAGPVTVTALSGATLGLLALGVLALAALLGLPRR